MFLASKARLVCELTQASMAFYVDSFTVTFYFFTEAADIFSELYIFYLSQEV
jgi:hypothetical protein